MTAVISEEEWMSMIGEEEWMRASDAMKLFSSLYGDKIGEHVFYHLANPKVLKIRSMTVRNKDGVLKKWYSRTDTIAQAEERRKTKNLIPLREGWRRLVKDHNLPRVKEEHFQKLVVKEKRIPIIYSNDQAHWIRPKDVAVIAEMIAPDPEKEHRIAKLMTTAEAVIWVNTELEKQGSSTRVSADTIYHWIQRDAIGPADVVPGVTTKFATYRFSEETLRNSRPFRWHAAKISE